VKMYLPTAQFSALFSVFVQQYVAAEPAPVSPRQESILELRVIDDRQFSGDLSFCFGENSICSFSTDLFEDCQGFLGADENEWFQCICGNGYVSVDEA
jgi:hypothetical protein